MKIANVEDLQLEMVEQLRWFREYTFGQWENTNKDFDEANSCTRH